MIKGTGLVNETAWIVNEYATRKRLAGLGYTTDIRNLSGFKAECFCIIEEEIEKTLAQEAKKRGSRNSRI